ncbi:MAG: restriction endonuclease subunit S, partial [Hymenobacter sp.]
PATGKLQPLSRFLTQRKVFITIDDATEYKRCRVQSNRKGIVLRDLAKGAAINTKKQQLCRPGDFIVAEIDAKVGGYGFIPDELDGAIVSSHYYLFEVDESQLLPRYLYYLTQSDIIQSQISSQGSTNYAAIRPKEFLAIEIPYVEPDQQHEIVTKLDTLTQEAEAFNQDSVHQATLLTRLHQAVLREAVQGRLVPQDATDEPALVLLDRINTEKKRLVKEKKLRVDKPLLPLSETEIPYKVPPGWAWCRLGELMDIASGVTKGKRYKEELLDTPYLAVANVQRGYLQLDNIKRIAVPTNEIEKYALHTGDLLMTEGGDADKLGRCALWNNELEQCIHQNHIFRVRILAGSIIPEYAMSYINSASARAYFLGSAKQTTNLASINLTQLKNTPFPLPPLLEQQRIVAKITELLINYTSLEAELLRAQQMAQAMHASALREAFCTPSTQLAYSN